MKLWYSLKKNFVDAFSGAYTVANVHGSSNLGFIIGAALNTLFEFPDPRHETLISALASVCNSSFVLRLGTYDFLSC